MIPVENLKKCDLNRVRQIIGTVVERIRLKSGRPASVLSYVVGINRKTVARIEQGTGDYTIDSLLRVVHELGKSYHDFFAEISKEFSEEGKPMEDFPTSLTAEEVDGQIIRVEIITHRKNFEKLFREGRLVNQVRHNDSFKNNF